MSILTVKQIFEDTFQPSVQTSYKKVFGSRDRLYRVKNNINLLNFEELRRFVENSPYSVKDIYDAFAKESK